MTSQEWASDSQLLTSPIHTSCKQCCHGQVRLAFQAEEADKSRISGGVWPADVALALWVTSSGHQAGSGDRRTRFSAEGEGGVTLGGVTLGGGTEVPTWGWNLFMIFECTMYFVYWVVFQCRVDDLKVPWCGYWDITREGGKLQFILRSGNSLGCSVPWHPKKMTILNPRCYDELP